MRMTNILSAYLLGKEDGSGAWVWDDGTSMVGDGDVIKTNHWSADPLVPSGAASCLLDKATSKITCDAIFVVDGSKGFFCKFPVSVIGFNAVIQAGVLTPSARWTATKALSTVPNEFTPPLAGDQLVVEVPAWKQHAAITRDVWLDIYPNHVKDFGAATINDNYAVTK